MKYLYILLFFISTNIVANELCPYKNDDSISILQSNIFEFYNPINALGHLNAGELEKLRKVLIDDLGSSVVAINTILSHPNCNFPQLEVVRAKKLLKRVAIMIDKYPVPEWEGDEILIILEKAKRFDEND